MKESFILYTEYAKHLALLNMEQRGVLLTAIMSYQLEEELPEMDGATGMAFSFIKEQLEKDNTKYEETVKKRSEAGKQGGRPKANEEEEKQTKAKKANAISEKQTKAKKPDNEHDNDYDYYNSSVGLNAGAGAREDVEEQTAEYRAFMQEHPKIVADITNPSLVGTVDFALLSEKIAESGFLQTRYSLSWLIGNYRKIISDGYKDYRRAPPKEGGDAQLQYLRELYEEAKEEDRRNAEKRSS